MVKLKKQVAINKARYFLKTTPLVIFFQCINKDDFHEKLMQMLFETPFNSTSKAGVENRSIKDLQNRDEGSLKNLIVKKEVTVRVLKNNYAKKVFIEDRIAKSNNIKPFFPYIEETSSIGIKGKYFNSDTIKKNEKVENLNKESCKMSLNKFDLSLFQGNNLLIGLTNTTLFDMPNFKKVFIEDTSINLLGGIYENNIVDNNQIKRLSRIGKDKQVYGQLKNKLQNNALTLVDLMGKRFRFDYLLYQHHKIIFLLKEKARIELSNSKIV